MRKFNWFLLGVTFAILYLVGYYDGRRPNLKRGVWVLIQTGPDGRYHVAGITNANTVFVTNLNIQGWTK